MANTKLLGQPVNFFRRMDYSSYEYSQPIDPEDYLGEEHEVISYEYINLKTGKEEYGTAFHNEPYFPASIPAVSNSVNVVEHGEGNYDIDESITEEECMQVMRQLVDSGVPMMDITADTVLENLHKKDSKTY